MIILTGAKVGEEVLVAEEAFLGRLTECDLVLDDKLSSRKHAKVKLGPDGVYLEDLGSSNGTKLHGERIREARLEDGDQFEIGTTSIRVRIQARPAPDMVAPSAPAAPVAPVAKAAKAAKAAKGPRGRGGGLQYHRIEDRGGFLGEDIAQRSGLIRILLLALVLAVGAGLFLLAYHAVR